MVQLGPDFFNFALILIAYFFWSYKEVVGPVDEADLRSCGRSGCCRNGRM
jgi:hypothetical protein